MKTLLVVLGSMLMLAFLATCAPVNGAVDTLPEQVQVMMDQQEGAYVLVQLSGTLNAETERQLGEAGIVLFDPVGEYQFQAYVPATAVPALTALQANHTIVAVTAIDPADKLKGAFSEPQKVYDVVVQFYAAPTEAQTAVLADSMIVTRTAVGVMNFTEGQATGEQIRQLADLPFVKSIAEAVVSTGGNRQP